MLLAMWLGEEMKCSVAVSRFILAEILRTEGTYAENHCLENFVTHRAKKLWLSCDVLTSVRPFVRTYVCPFM